MPLCLCKKTFRFRAFPAIGLTGIGVLRNGKNGKITVGIDINKHNLQRNYTPHENEFKCIKAQISRISLLNNIWNLYLAWPY